MIAMDNSVAVVEWLKSMKSKKTCSNYRERWATWIQYCKAKGLLEARALPIPSR